MAKSSKKLTSEQVKDKNQSFMKDSSEKKSTSRFSGMAEKAVMLTPVIIPGYKIRG